MNEPKKIFLASVVAVLLAQAGLAWGGPIPEAVSKLPSILPTEYAKYQDIISKAFPGYQILNPSEVFMDKEEIGPELYSIVKDNPGLIVGKFNDDNIEDFVALIRRPTTKTYSWSPHGKFIDKNNIEKYDVYAVNLAVCYGLGGGKFDCTKQPRTYGEVKPGIFGEVFLPSDFALNKTGTGKYVCTSLKLNLQQQSPQYRDQYREYLEQDGKHHGEIDNMGVISMYDDGNNAGMSLFSVVKLRPNVVLYDLRSDITVLRCTGFSEDDPIPEAVSQLQSNLPTEYAKYQDAISNAFPGSRILSPSEILLDKEEMGPELYNQVKASPGLIMGKFNNDNIEDFAALTRDTTKKTYHRTLQGEVVEESYEAHLVVCYGLGGGKFDCTKIPGVFDYVGLSTDCALNKTGPGKYLCLALQKIDLRKNREPYDKDYGEKTDVSLTVKTDIISVFSFRSFETKYIYQSKIAYLQCNEFSGD